MATFVQSFAGIRFDPNDVHDKSVWYHPTRKLYVAVFVDDLLIVGSKGQADKLSAFMRHSKDKVELTVKPLEAFLGKEYEKIIVGDTTTYRVTVTKKIEELARDCDDVPVDPVTPCPSTNDWMAPQTPEEVKNARHLRFRELIGSLLYISRSRPDIRYAVQKLTRFGNDWGKA